MNDRNMDFVETASRLRDDLPVVCCHNTLVMAQTLNRLLSTPMSLQPMERHEQEKGSQGS